MYINADAETQMSLSIDIDFKLVLFIMFQEPIYFRKCF